MDACGQVEEEPLTVMVMHADRGSLLGLLGGRLVFNFTCGRHRLQRREGESGEVGGWGRDLRDVIRTR